jgi:hypothetical protein
MNDDFIPLLPVTPPPAPTPAFTPAAPSATAGPTAPTPPAAPAPADHAPRLTVRQAGERITHVIVHCVCGEQIELTCEHAP